MPTKVRIVPDSNVYIAAALNNGYCHDWLFGASNVKGQYELFTAENILFEVDTKLTTKFHFDRLTVAVFLTNLDAVLKKVRPRIALDVVRDEKDNMILECAVEANADLILTFDNDLLTLKAYNNIRIIHPSMMKYIFDISAK